ncbi:hypothetical protein KIS1582_4963 [Cytobacillus firmus]|uniref:Uncharacterized protein n=1 Tax=Cytobacillus firmus TaxID=1399 RepID=A0A800N842_CYTFI|nr:hypothetical protein KIS1582_4963 [Cytobacillus firmus]
MNTPGKSGTFYPLFNIFTDNSPPFAIICIKTKKMPLIRLAD